MKWYDDHHLADDDSDDDKNMAHFTFWKKCTIKINILVRCLKEDS